MALTDVRKSVLDDTSSAEHIQDEIVPTSINELVRGYADIDNLPVGSYAGQVVVVENFYEGTDGGGGTFRWDTSKDPTVDHNGGTIIDPLHNTNAGQLGWWVPFGSSEAGGCWVRTTEGDTYTPEMWGVRGNGSQEEEAWQAIIDDINSFGGGIIQCSSKTYTFGAALVIKDHVSIFGTGPFSTILKYTGTGTNGIETSAAAEGVHLKDFQLLGTNTTNASENGINFDGDTTGMNKLVLENLLVKEWGNVGIYLENCWDSTIRDVNASSNKSHGLQGIQCNSASIDKIVAYRNDGEGVLLQSIAGASISGTVQENNLTGLHLQSAKGCQVNVYAEQNGHTGSTNDEKSQIVLDQRAGGFSVSSGNEVVAFLLGGKGSTGPTYESTYGIYIDFAENNNLTIQAGGHLTSNIFFTSNSSNNTVVNAQHETGLAGGDTPSETEVTDNGNNSSKSYAGFANTPTTGVGNGTTVETDLFTYTLPGGTLNTNKQSLDIIAYGQTAANANLKTLKLYLGSSVLLDTGAVAVNNKEWVLKATLTRRSDALSYCITEGVYNDSPVIDFTAQAEDFTGDLTIKCTGQSDTASDDITQRGLIVRN